jgi:hypothetical protein
MIYLFVCYYFVGIVCSLFYFNRLSNQITLLDLIYSVFVFWSFAPFIIAFFFTDVITQKLDETVLYKRKI